MATRYWTVGNIGTYSFNSSANWLYGAVPGPTDIAEFNEGGTFTITGNATIAELLLGYGRISLTGSYTMTGAQPTEIFVAVASPASPAALIIEQGASVEGNQAVTVSGSGSSLEVDGDLAASSLTISGGLSTSTKARPSM